MVQSINTKVDLATSGVSYLGIGGKVGKILVGDKGFEFYNDNNIADFIQIPWSTISQMGANVHKRRVSRHFEIATNRGKFLFASKDAGKILKLARQQIGNDKVVKLPTLLQKLGRLLAKKK